METRRDDRIAQLLQALKRSDKLHLKEAATLLGVELSVDDVVGHMVIGFPNSLPPQTPEHRERVGALTAAAAELDGFEITGAWYAGTGLAAVVPHGRAVAEKLVVKHDDDDAP